MVRKNQAGRTTATARANSAEVAAQFWLPLYLGLGISRSITRVVELAHAAGIQISRGTIARYSQVGHWVERAREWDDARAQSVQHIAIDEIMNNEARQAQLGRLMQETAISEIARRHGMITGTPDERRSVPPEPFSGIARMGEAGVKIERLAAGQATEIREVLVGVYQVVTIEVADLWMAGQRAQQAVYEAAGIVDAGLHARAQNAAAEVFGPGLDTLVRQNFTQLGIGDVVFGDDPAIVDEREDE